MTKTKQTACRYRPEPNPFLGDNRETESSSDMSQEHLINTSPPASLDEAQPTLPLAQGEVMQDDPTGSLGNLDIQEVDAEMQEDENPSNANEIPEIEEAEEEAAAIEVDDDSPSKPIKKKMKKKKDKNAHKNKTPGVQQPHHTVPITTPAESSSNTEAYLAQLVVWEKLNWQPL